MKNWLVIFFICVGVHGWGQVDTLNPLTSLQIADSVYGNLNNYTTTGRLYNRLLIEDTNFSISWNTKDFCLDSTNNFATSDNIYGLLYEAKYMSVDTSSIVDPLNVFKTAQSYTGEQEFNLKRYVYQIGVFDLEYNYFDENQELSFGNITKSNQVFYPSPGLTSFPKKRARLIAPMYDYFDSDSIGFIFTEQYFYSDSHVFSDISEIKFNKNGMVSLIIPNAISYFKIEKDSVQKFMVEITFSNGDKIGNYFILQTPELSKSKGKKNDESTLPGCTEFLIDGSDEIEISGNKIQWCLIPRCDYDGRILKPFFLLTGYRPPIIGQSFEKTWQFYNDEHEELLNNLIANNYDVFLVRFNIHQKPFSHGMIESAELLMKFIEGVNVAKNSSLGHENVIQGSSMSADIARLTLLTMEKKHLEDNTYPHHHSRLFISYDANFYGANLPLAYQYQIISHVKHPMISLLASGVPILGGIYIGYQATKWLLSLYLYSTLEQTTVKQLLQYHALASDPLLFTSPIANFDLIPQMHSKRLEFYDALSFVDNHQHIFPMPIACRNISISLGKIKNTNSYDDSRFIEPGENWININTLIWRFKLSAAKYTPSGTYNNLFIRRKTGLNWTSLWSVPFVQHKVNVSQMQELDNASGSYLPGSGNLIQVGNLAYFPLSAGIDAISGSDLQFSHKAVVTALGINKNLWPSNGSMTLDLHQMGLMFNSLGFDPNDPNDYSNNFGYPNLGRPNDHFLITPFEAIYLDTTINPHIRYNEAEDAPDVPFVNDFMLNEIEPWYLGLQNMNLGSTARSNYTYYSYRRAKHHILVGHNVSPTTDQGDYVVEENANLTLKAGDEINIKSGVHFKAGSTVHIVPEYEVCNDLKNGSITNGSNHSETTSVNNKEITDLENTTSETSVTIYPNPTFEKVSIKVSNSNEIVELTICDLMGKAMFQGNYSTNSITLNLEFLKEGVYFVKIKLFDNSYTTKQIQKL